MSNKMVSIKAIRLIRQPCLMVTKTVETKKVENIKLCECGWHSDSGMTHLCHCGCGEQTKFYRGKPNRFIYGHHNRGKNAPMYGRKHTEETKLKISIKAKQDVGRSQRLSGKNNPKTGRFVKKGASK